MLSSLQALNQDKIFESCVTEIKAGKEKFLVAGVYRTPSQDVDIYLEKLSELLKILSKTDKKILLGGDFNIDVLREDNKKKKFVNVLQMHGFKYTIKIPTRVAEKSVSAIDNFITNLDNNFFEVECLITALSDHDGQLFKILSSKSTKNNLNLKIHKYERRYKQESINLFIYDLSKEDWTKLYDCNVEDKFTYFYNILKYYFNLHFPKTKIVSSNVNNGWIDDEIINEHHEIIAEHDLYRDDRSNIALKNYIKEHKKR